MVYRALYSDGRYTGYYTSPLQPWPHSYPYVLRLSIEGVFDITLKEAVPATEVLAIVPICLYSDLEPVEYREGTG